MYELADQLTGVLHEIAAADSGTPHPRLSTHFSPQRAIYGGGWDVPLTVASVIAALGVPRVDASDPGAALLATTSGTPPAQLEQTLHARRRRIQPRRSNSVEVPLRLVRASLELGAATDARKRLAELESVLAGDWRLKWYSGQCALLEGDLDAAAADFDAVLAMLPGELDPKLALAATAELRGAHDGRHPLLRDGVADQPHVLQRGVRPRARARRERATAPAPWRHSTRSPPLQRISPPQGPPPSRSFSMVGPPNSWTNPRSSMRASARPR